MVAPLPRPETVLVEGKLHPATILLRALLIARQALWLVLFAVINYFVGDGGLSLWVVLPLFFFGALGMIAPVVEYLRFSYRLTPTELQITQGLLSVQERRIPLDRIQDLATEQTPLRRLLGVVQLQVETSGGRGAEAKLDAISAEAAARLRAAMHEATSGRVAAGAVEPASAPSGELLHRVGVGSLILRGLSDNRSGLVIAGLLGLLHEAFEVVGIERVVDAAVAELELRLGATTAIWAGIALLVAALVVGGWIASAVVNVLRFAGFTLTAVDDPSGGVLVRRFGLFTKRVQTMPRARIQAIRLEQSPMHRLFGIAVIRADNAGSAAGPSKQQEKAGTDVFVPSIRVAEVDALAAKILPGVRPADVAWQPTSRTIIRRWSARGLILGAAGAAVLWVWVGLPALGAIGLVVPASIGGWLAFRALRFGWDGRVLAARWGVLGRHRALVPADRIEAVTLTATPIERWQGIAHLSVFVTGGAHVTLVNLPRATAADLLEQVAAAAAAQTC